MAVSNVWALDLTLSGRDSCSMGHLEAFARRSADKYSEMKVHQGVHLKW